MLSPAGCILSKWGQRDLTDLPVEEDVLYFIRNLRAFYMENKEIMCKGNMIKPLPYTTGTVTYACEYGRSYEAEEVLSAAYELDGEKMQIFVNYHLKEKIVICNGERIAVPALSVLKKSLS